MRITAVPKISIDTRIRTKHRNLGRNLLIGVPPFCQTVGQFKRHVARRYLKPKAPIHFWSGQFWIPDRQDSSLFSLLKEPIRIAPIIRRSPTVDSEAGYDLPPSDQAPMTPSDQPPKRVKIDPTIQVFNISSGDADDSDSDAEMEAIYDEIHNEDIDSTEAGDAPTSPKGKKRLRKTTEEGFGVIAQDDYKGSGEDQDVMDAEIKDLDTPPSPPGNHSPRVIPYVQSPTPNKSKTQRMSVLNPHRLELRDGEAEDEPYVSSLPSSVPHTKRVRLSVD